MKKFTQSTRVNLVFCAACLTFFIAAFISRRCLSFLHLEQLRKYVFHGVHVIPNFLRWNQFRSNIWVSFACRDHSRACTETMGVGGVVASWLVRSTPERAVRVRALAGDIVLCSWARHFTLTVPLSTQV